MNKNSKYEVVRSGLDSYSIGDIIELTKDQAASRVNKVKLVSNKKEATEIDETTNIEAVNKLQAKVKELEGEIARITEKGQALEARATEAEAKVKEFEKSIEDSAKEQKKSK